MEDHKLRLLPFLAFGFGPMPFRFAPRTYGQSPPSTLYGPTKPKPKSKLQKKKLRKLSEASRRRNRKAA